MSDARFLKGAQKNIFFAHSLSVYFWLKLSVDLALAKRETLYVAGAANLIVNVDYYAIVTHVFLGNFKTRRQRGEKFREYALVGHADRTAERASHACVADVGRAAGQDLLVRSLHMRMRTDKSGNTPVKIQPHDPLF